MQPPGGLRCNTLQILLSPRRPEVYNKKKIQKRGLPEKRIRNTYLNHTERILKGLYNILEFIKLIFYVFDAQGMVQIHKLNMAVRYVLITFIKKHFWCTWKREHTFLNIFYFFVFLWKINFKVCWWKLSFIKLKF